MYRYDSYDQRLVDERAEQFAGQVRRYRRGEIGEDEFKQLRLRNGLYLQRHAYMLRVAIPYGLLSSGQMRNLAHIARRYDRGYGHFTTRQNIQYNWPTLAEVPDLLADLATVEMKVAHSTYRPVGSLVQRHPNPLCHIDLHDWHGPCIGTPGGCGVWHMVNSPRGEIEMWADAYGGATFPHPLYIQCTQYD